MRKRFVIISLLLCTTISRATEDDYIYRYRVCLTDKRATEYSLEHPEEYLSEKALTRRKRQGIKPDSTDLPVCRDYVTAIARTGVRPVTTSKWQNSLVVQCHDTNQMDTIASLPFVRSVEKVWTMPESVAERNKLRKQEIEDEWETSGNYYGAAYEQIAIHRGDSLHRAGFRGAGMTIAVIDAGYYNADAIGLLHDLNLAGTRDFVNPDSDLYAENSHGMKVLSCMSANKPYVMVGTAPEASYWLLRSEDTDSEQPVEQDYWAAAVEFADSTGADIINTSLGYRAFDDPSKNYAYHHLDGRYSLISRQASMIADKGMILVCSAGNEGMKSWKKITPPADADHILAVGAVNASGMNALFSSVGNTTDNRVKPDAMAIGYQTAVAGTAGEISVADGTSFASPVLCGLVACLWQARPHLTAKEVIELVRHTGDRSDEPDNVFGYGIPDIWEAYKISGHE